MWALKAEFIAATITVGRDCVLLEPLAVITRAAKAAKAWRSMTHGGWYSCDTILKRLAQGLEDLAAAFGEYIQE